jgi:hypothetical protein
MNFDQAERRNKPKDSYVHIATDFTALHTPLCTYTSVFVATLWPLQWVIMLPLHPEEHDEVLMMPVATPFSDVGRGKERHKITSKITSQERAYL